MRWDRSRGWQAAGWGFTPFTYQMPDMPHIFPLNCWRATQRQTAPVFWVTRERPARHQDDRIEVRLS